MSRPTDQLARWVASTATRQTPLALRASNAPEANTQEALDPYPWDPSVPLSGLHPPFKIGQSHGGQTTLERLSLG